MPPKKPEEQEEKKPQESLLHQQPPPAASIVSPEKTEAKEKTEANIALAQQGLEQLHDLGRSLAAAGPVLDAVKKARKELSELDQAKAAIEADRDRLERSKQQLFDDTAGLKDIYDKAKAAHDERMAKLKKDWEELSLKIEEGEKNLAQIAVTATEREAEANKAQKAAEDKLKKTQEQLAQLGTTIAASARAQ